MLLADKLIGHIIPVRFALFALIGGFGLVIHLAVLWVSLDLLGAEFRAAQTVATVVGDDLQLLLEQPVYLSRSAAARVSSCAGSQLST